MPKLVFGLVGPIASGKGTVVNILRDSGYHAYSLSDVLKDEVRSRGLEVSRYNCNRISNELRQNQGADILAQKTAKFIESENPEVAVVDAIRNPSEIKFLKDKFNIKIIGVVADQKKRYEMFVQRGAYANEIKSFEDFCELDNREMQQEGDYKQQVNKCLEMADNRVENNGTMAELAQKIQEIIISQTVNGSTED